MRHDLGTRDDVDGILTMQQLIRHLLAFLVGAALAEEADVTQLQIGVKV